MEGPSTHCMVEDIEYRGGFTARELVIQALVYFQNQLVVIKC